MRVYYLVISRVCDLVIFRVLKCLAAVESPTHFSPENISGINWDNRHQTFKHRLGMQKSLLDLLAMLDLMHGIAIKYWFCNTFYTRKHLCNGSLPSLPPSLVTSKGPHVPSHLQHCPPTAHCHVSNLVFVSRSCWSEWIQNGEQQNSKITKHKTAKNKMMIITNQRTQQKSEFLKLMAN